MLLLFNRFKLCLNLLFMFKVITPHIGSATSRTETDMATISALNVLAGLGGEPMYSPVLY